MSKQVISTPKAPAAIGPYSQALRIGNLIFVSGQIPLDPATGQLVGKDIARQTERVLKNLAAILEAAGSNLDRAVKTTVYLRDLNDFSGMNEVYAGFLGASPPARATVQVARLPRDVAIEIDLIAEAWPRSSAAGLFRFLNFSRTDTRRADAKGLMGAVDDGANAPQVGIPAPRADVVSVTDPVSELGSFPANFANLSHSNTSPKYQNCKKRTAFYQIILPLAIPSGIKEQSSYSAESRATMFTCMVC